MTDTAERQGSVEDSAVQISPEAFQAFEAMFELWLDQNQDELELAGSGNLEALATLCAQWALTNLSVETGAARPHNFSEPAGAL